MRRILWRAANDDYVDTGYSFAEERKVAEVYLDNPGFGGDNLYRAKIEYHKDSVLDWTETTTGIAASILDMSDPGAIELDEWLPRTPQAMDKLHKIGYQWVKVSESYPRSTTWIWIGDGSDDEPKLELVCQQR